MIVDEDILRLRRELQRLADGRSWLKGSTLVHRLSEGLGISHLDVRQGLRALRQQKVIDNIGPTGDPLGRVTIAQPLVEAPPSVAPHIQMWLDLLQSHDLEPEARAALIEFGTSLVDLSREDMECLLQGILRLVEDRASFAGRDPYEVSAKYLLGSSKILGRLSKFLGAFGVTGSDFGNRPRYVLGAGPRDGSFTLLVENPECFDRLVWLGATSRIIAIATYGYGIMWSGIGIEGELNRIKIARVAGEPPATLADACRAETCCFWGDLDLAGLDQFVKLRTLVPHLRLSALYEPMLRAVARTATSHPYCRIVDKDGQAQMTVSDVTAADLVSACRHRAVDQECVSDADIVSLADRTLQFSR